MFSAAVHFKPRGQLVTAQVQVNDGTWSQPDTTDRFMTLRLCSEPDHFKSAARLRNCQRHDAVGDRQGVEVHCPECPVLPMSAEQLPALTTELVLICYLSRNAVSSNWLNSFTSVVAWPIDRPQFVGPITDCHADDVSLRLIPAVSTTHRGLSREAFADQLGHHRTYVGGLERGKRNLTLIAVERIAERLDLEPLGLLQIPTAEAE